MLTLLFFVLLVSFIIKVFGFAMKAAWGVTKVVLAIVCFPLFLVGLAFSGAIYVAIVLLIVGGLFSLIGRVLI